MQDTIPLVIRLALALLLLLLLPQGGWSASLMPGELMVLYSASDAESVALAREYAQVRKVPEENLLALTTPPGETISREDFDRFMAGPLRKRLTKSPTIKVLLLMYGLPLRVLPRALTFQEKMRLSYLKWQRAANEVQDDKEMQGMVNRSGETASVDSELTLARVERYPLEGWQDNPLAKRNAHRLLSFSKEEILMVSRLDAPDPGMVRRMMADSLLVERQGLSGTACIDARWPLPKEQTGLTAYAHYDLSLHRLASQLKARKWPVIIDSQDELLPSGLGLRTALYCGWYSLGRYIDSFVWQPGAVGYHIASGECETLKGEGSDVWCKRMIEKGITATLGPVAEPYVQAFPLPDEFFPLLMDGLTLVESYFQSLPHLSWRMVLIGDPLYRPFGK